MSTEKQERSPMREKVGNIVFYACIIAAILLFGYAAGYNRAMRSEQQARAELQENMDRLERADAELKQSDANLKVMADACMEALTSADDRLRLDLIAIRSCEQRKQ